MKVITASKITKTVADLCITSNQVLRSDVLKALQNLCKSEKNARARRILEAIIANAGMAKSELLAICQDTGFPIVFLELGQDVRISGDLNQAVQRGIESGYKKGSLRDSIVKDPLERGKPGFNPGIMHVDITRGNKLKITVLPKGFGCENKSQMKMFLPTAKLAQIKEFIIDAVKAAGPDACPPYVVGVGIGGTADYAAFLAKKALLRKLRTRSSKLEKDLLSRVNKLNIGPMGLGGSATCLAVNIETYPTHIAGLAVAVNISCHALRSATAIL
jgi:fumarate hydratase subunit alpha